MGAARAPARRLAGDARPSSSDTRSSCASGTGLSYSEIAERLELSQAAVETLLFRARRSLARRLRQPLGVGSFLPWLRSLGEGGAAKVALGVAAAAVTATTGAVTIAHQHQHRPAARTRPVQTAAPAPRTVSGIRPARVAPAKHHGTAAKTTSARAALPRQPQQPAAKPTPTQPRADSPVASAPTVSEPVTAAQPITNTSTTATTSVAAPVVDTVTSVVNNTTDTVANTAADAVATAQTGNHRRHEHRADDHRPLAPLTGSQRTQSISGEP